MFGNCYTKGMLSDKTKQHIETLLAGQSAYHPNTETQVVLAEKTLIMLIGPTGAGKSTVMREVTKLMSDISIVGTITTRPARPDDQLERYTFYDHTNEGLQALFDDIAAGRLVQYAVNPYSHHIYGSSIGDYPAAINIGDYFSSVVGDFQSYGFGGIIPITIATEAGSWQQRFDERFPPDHPQRASRRAEAIASLTWSLGEHQTPHFFVLNPEGSPETAAHTIIAILQGLTSSQTAARDIAAACLQAIQKEAA